LRSINEGIRDEGEIVTFDAAGAVETRVKVIIDRILHNATVRALSFHLVPTVNLHNEGSCDPLSVRVSWPHHPDGCAALAAAE
jgi:hypothetical protein